MEDPESYKIFNFREHTLKMDENDAPSPRLQSALKNMCVCVHTSNCFFRHHGKGRVYYS
jgi:hypothetical protein